MIDVCMTAWPTRMDRVFHFAMTLDALQRNLSGADFRLFCSVETEGSLLTKELEKVAYDFAVELFWRDAPANLGAAMNSALRMGDSEFLLMVQDDWELTEPLDVTESVAFLDHHPDFTAIRYQFVDSMRLIDHLDGFQVVDMSQTWPFLDSPRLQQRSMVVEYGEQVEGLKHCAAEHRYGRYIARLGAKIAAYPRSVFRHLGTESAKTEAEPCPEPSSPQLSSPRL